MEISLIAHLEALDGLAEQLDFHLLELAEHVCREPGNRLFQVYRRRDEPNRFEVVETYVDDAAFASHIAQPHSERFKGLLSTLAVGGQSQLTFVRAR